MNTLGRFFRLSGLRRFGFSLVRGIVVVLPICLTEAMAQSEDDLVFYPAEVEAILNLDYIDRQSQTNSSKETEWELGVSVKQEAHYLDPGIARLLIDIEPVLSVNKYESTTLTEDKDGELINYLLQLDMLRDTPSLFAFDINAQRESNLITGSLGSRFDNEIDRKQAVIHWKNPAFPMNLSYTEKSFDQEFDSSQSNQISQRDELTNTWLLSGRSNKLNIRVEHKTLDDRIISRNNDFEQDQAHLNHRLNWGRASVLSSRINLYDREGFNANKRKALEEHVRIQHTDNVFSQTTYRYDSITQNIEAEEQYLKFELNHRLYQNLDSKASIDIETVQSDIVESQINGINLESRYRKRNLIGAAVNAGVGLAYEETDRDSSTGLIDVIEESQTVPISGQVTLNTRFIILTSIIVTDDSGSLVYDEGFDYEINNLTGNLTQIQIIPNGRINQGDTILISYQATALPTQDFSTTRNQYNLGIDMGWLRFSHSDQKSDDKLQSGADESFLNDTRYTLSDIEFRWKIKNADVLAGFERSYSMSSGFESTNYSYQQRVSWANSRDIRWNITATESSVEQQIRETDLFSLNLSLNWKPSANLSVRPYVTFWQREDKQLIGGSKQNDEFSSVGFRLNWRYRKIIIDLSYYHNQREVKTDQFNTASSTDEDRLMFKLSRRFF